MRWCDGVMMHEHVNVIIQGNEIPVLPVQP